MSTYSKRAKTLRASLFGPPPILPGENPKAYEDMLERVVSAIGPRDFIEEIWARDLADVGWQLFRWRRILAAYLADHVSDATDEQASRLAIAETETLHGTEKEEMDRFLTSELRWHERVASHPRANEKFHELTAAAKSTLNMDLVQAGVMRTHFYSIQQIESLIGAAQQRVDDIMRELDRHRAMQKHCSHSPHPQTLNADNTQPKMIARKPTTGEAA
jgi:hypothetical protein